MMNTSEVVKFLNSRGVKDEDYLSFIQKPVRHFTPILCSVSGYDFMLADLFDCSDNEYRSIEKINKRLAPDDILFTLIGRVEGDDVVCYNSMDGCIYLWLTESDNYHYMKVADSFSEFLTMTTSYSE